MEDPCSIWTHIIILESFRKLSEAFKHQVKFPVVTLQARGNKGSGGSAAKKASKGGNPVGNPLSGVGTGLPQVGVAPKKAAKAASNAGKKANKTANKAASKVCSLTLSLCCNPLLHVPQTGVSFSSHMASSSAVDLLEVAEIAGKQSQPLQADQPQKMRLFETCSESVEQIASFPFTPAFSHYSKHVMMSFSDNDQEQSTVKLEVVFQGALQ